MQILRLMGNNSGRAPTSVQSKTSVVPPSHFFLCGISKLFILMELRGGDTVEAGQNLEP